MDSQTRHSQQRHYLLQELRGLDTHPAADELYESLKSRLPRLSLGTVYRNLELLARQGAILKLEQGGGQRRYDGNTSPHSHVRCLRCGAVGDLFQPLPEVPLAALQAQTDFLLTGYQTELLGYCPTCRAAEESGRSGQTDNEEGRS